MARPKIRVVMNHKGARSILRSDGVRADLLRRAQAIAATAGAGMDAEAEVGKNRARAQVTTATTAARAREAHRKALTSAIDAGRL